MGLFWRRLRSDLGRLYMYRTVHTPAGTHCARFTDSIQGHKCSSSSSRRGGGDESPYGVSELPTRYSRNLHLETPTRPPTGIGQVRGPVSLPLAGSKSLPFGVSGTSMVLFALDTESPNEDFWPFRCDDGQLTTEYRS
ncbi:uncharacterized protein BO72DRAFT_78248 [Aspergillus fijiensis CBS 313.89]|uniref:Uncharacterized protein n=1 Tax=Aspergillus fijiensis CBS 313.89 TaxID=1448319 RepID=A0A8G1RRM4_9EURO|nr:uncharacterized protein BO72DRAFT_78248 [Aspergillus fijiensis CBS 313.89]RAK78215.1 hypothetical protein BO72DRAFT_78248 [Aspergillus fijiensis CBS 313.89]